MDPWTRQRTLARTTVVWSTASLAGGVLAMTRDDLWWRSFGQQHVGWGLVDLGIVAAVTKLQHRRMRRAGNPYAPAALEQERRKLRIILAANAVADIGYVVTGAVLWRRGHTRRASGAGAAIVIQGSFLALHDSWHAARAGR